VAKWNCILNTGMCWCSLEYIAVLVARFMLSMLSLRSTVVAFGLYFAGFA
jgi:hypothetical protein